MVQANDDIDEDTKADTDGEGEDWLGACIYSSIISSVLYIYKTPYPGNIEVARLDMKFSTLKKQILFMDAFISLIGAG